MMEIVYKTFSARYAINQYPLLLGIGGLSRAEFCKLPFTMHLWVVKSG